MALAVAKVLIEQISVPERAEGDSHRVRVVLRAAQETVATLRLYRGTLPVAAATVELPPGTPQVYAFDQLTPSGSGAILYRARVEAEGDATAENNRAEALVEVAGRPSVLVQFEPAARRSGTRLCSG